MIVNNFNMISISDDENCLYEAYEGINFNKKIKVLGFYIVCLFLFYLFALLIPSEEITQEKALQSKYSVLILKIKYKEILSYQPFVTLTIENRNNYLNIISLNLNTKLTNSTNHLLNANQIKYNNLSISFNLRPGQKQQLIKYKDVKTDNLDFVYTANIYQGSYNNIFLIWKHLNPNIIPLSICTKIAILFTLYRISFKLNQRFSSFNLKIPTSSNTQQKIILQLLALLFIPLPELSFFSYLYFFKGTTIIFQIIYKAAFLSLFHSHLLSLKDIKQPKNTIIHNQSLLIFIILIFIFTLTEREINNPILTTLPYIFIVCLGIYELVFCITLFNQKNKFTTSILFYFFILSSIVVCLISIHNKSSWYSKTDFYLKLTMTLSYIFITFLRWPFEDITVANEENDFDNDLNDTTD